MGAARDMGVTVAVIAAAVLVTYVAGAVGLLALTFGSLLAMIAVSARMGWDQ